MKYFESIKSYSVISLGLFLSALSWVVFLIPYRIVGGGINGIGVMINFATGFPVGVFYLIVNVFLMFLAIKSLGAHFGVKTIYGILIFSLLMTIMESFIKEPILDDAFMATILGGIINGIGMGLIFSQNGSTGGLDIISLVIAKYTHSSPGKINFYLNLGIIGSSYFVLGSLNAIIYGIVTMAAASYTLDQFLEGNKQSAQLYIISNKYKEIADAINKKLHRGVTVFGGVGWYTQQQKNVLMVIVRKREVPSTIKIIKDIDINAFTTVSIVRGVYGEGFEKIKL